MPKKQTYEALEQRVKKLEKEAIGCKQVEEKLRRSEEKYKTLTTSSLTGIFIHRDGRFVFVNDRFAKVHGYTTEELLGKEYKTLIHPDDREVIAERVSKRLKGDSVPYHYEVQRLKKDGETIWCEMMVAAIEYRGKPAIMGNIVNITKRKQAEKHVRTLTQQLMKAQENERQRISRYLHDSVAQDLSLLKIGCETLFDNYPSIHSGIRQKTSELSTILKRLISAVRDFAYNLHPPGLDQLGLVRTVYQYCEEFAETNRLNIDFLSAGMDDLTIPFDTEINLYRLIQEAFCNIKKHADADSVTVKMVASFPHIILRIEDNGKGFDVKDRIESATKEKRMGLRSMEERISLLNGKMKIKSCPPEGTKIFIEVPYKEKNRVRKEEHIDH
ncbi:MAG: PAS domain S-box protein [Thermodesulfobacteriota bacterium]|nr:PAS domain S-box protein [Thermodesulfobacteriota bacterium]